jgi:hypothetical protein
MANNHVTNPRDSDSWRFLRENADRASATAQTQHEAERIAKELAANSGWGVRIHRPHGGPIHHSNTFALGNDPHLPIDREH